MSDGDTSSMSQTEINDLEVPVNNLSNKSLEEMQLSMNSEINTDEDVDAGVDTEASITTVTELSNAEESTGNYAEADTKNKSKTMFLSLADNPEWYKHKCFKRYWDHYHYAMSWCKKHYQTYNKLIERDLTKHTQKTHRSGSHYNWYYGPSVQQLHPYWGSIPWQQGQVQNNFKVTRNTGNRRSRQKRKEPRSSSQELNENEEEHAEVSGSDHAFEMEITEEMIEFFSKSEEHRKQRDEKKKEDQEKERKEPELVNLEDVQASPQKERTVEAPKERPGSRRTSEMKMLYGKGAAMIHGMETALQMTFDRNKDLKQPKMWPNMPLKIVFN